MNHLIVPIGSFYPAQLGGPSNTMFWHCREFAKLNYRVDVITTSRGISNDYPKNIWVEVDGINVIYCSTYSRWIYHCIKGINQDSIVHLNSIFYWPSIVAYIIAAKATAEVFWSVRGELMSAALSRGKLKKRFFLFVFLKPLTRMVNFHATSSDENKVIKSFFPKNNIIKHPNYIQLGQGLKKEKKKRQILFLGRLDPIKNIEFLLKEFASAKFEESVELVIAGSDNNSYAKKLKSLVAELKIGNVSFKGEVKGEKKARLLEQSSLLVLPSLSENFGNVVIEALAVGTPVAASHNTPWHCLQEHESGFFLPLEYNLWSRLFQDYFNESGMKTLKQMSKNAVKYCEEHFDSRIGVKSWVKDYEKSRISHD